MENRIMMEPREAVEHPAHYVGEDVECIDAIEAAVRCQTDPVTAFLTGQVIKYLWRWPLKGGAENLRKARWYLDRLLQKARPITATPTLDLPERQFQRQAVAEDFAAEEETEVEKDRFSKGVENILRYQVGVSQEGEE